eukprot:TRINITY_DN12674_c0_g1_i1.p1 TRINITY_DN12674_c0_g1~~TRINITY_DN12674_c0_g1_i1.p1  ORF type:complete len:187 (-),score=14.19 TRINITY_DN12674_c0_g1_i1:12-572(-)
MTADTCSCECVNWIPIPAPATAGPTGSPTDPPTDAPIDAITEAPTEAVTANPTEGPTECTSTEPQCDMSELITQLADMDQRYAARFASGELTLDDLESLIEVLIGNLPSPPIPPPLAPAREYCNVVVSTTDPISPTLYNFLGCSCILSLLITTTLYISTTLHRCTCSMHAMALRKSVGWVMDTRYR